MRLTIATIALCAAWAGAASAGPIITPPVAKPPLYTLSDSGVEIDWPAACAFAQASDVRMELPRDGDSFAYQAKVRNQEDARAFVALRKQYTGQDCPPLARNP